MNAIARQPDLRALMMFDALPTGCIAHLVTDTYSMPHIRPGEFVVVDTKDRAHRHLELYVIQWESGRRVICQARNTGIKTVEILEEDAWSVGSLKKIAGRAAIDAYMDQESVRAAKQGRIATLTGLGWSDGWFTSEHLTKKLVGCVIGLYAPTFEGPMRTVNEGDQANG